MSARNDPFQTGNYSGDVAFETLKGKTLSKVLVGREIITLVVDTGETFDLSHTQDCCERVYVEDVAGDVHDLVGSPLLLAEEASSQDRQAWESDDDAYRESFTWTFYKLATIKGSVTIRFYGSSNGYYSERVDCTRTEKPRAWCYDQHEDCLKDESLAEACRDAHDNPWKRGSS